MDHLRQIEQDLRYVRQSIDRADTSRAPRLLCFLWAGIGLVGFSLIDLRAPWVPMYWAVAAPLGFVLSAWIGWRHALRAGQVATEGGRRHLSHWGALLAAVFMAWLMPALDVMSWTALGPTILLLLALSYFQAGVHFDSAFRWIGLVLAAGYLAVIFVDNYAWLTLGVLFALSLALAGLRSSPEHGTPV